MPATNALLQEGRYRINNEFPLEGSGTVYDAYDTVSETNVVVKEIPVKLNKVATISQRENLNIAFADQAKVLTEIKHDSLLHVRDFFSEIGRQYLVMESVDGDDLQALLDRQKGSFPVSDVASWADQLLDALHYLHNYRTPIVHRNIRPENIKLNSDGGIKLMSFGLDGGGDAQVNTDVSENAVAGAGIAYSPLEQIWNGLDAASQKVIISKYDERSERILKEDLDARSDIYSLGATLYHLVTARVPVDSLERSIEILEGRPDPLRAPNKIDPDIPPEISDVIIKAMEIKREYRFDSAAIMRQVFRTALVRVKEREVEEELEQEEAANDIRLAAQQKREIIVSEEISETERFKKQLQEAEEQRLLAEQRAAEAERRLHESEAARESRLEPPTIASFDDDLLGVLGPSVHISEAPKSPIPANDISLVEVVADAEPDFAVSQEQEMAESAAKDAAFSESVSVEEEMAESSTGEATFSESISAEEESKEEIAFSENESVDEDVKLAAEELVSSEEELVSSEDDSAEEDPGELASEDLASAQEDTAGDELSETESEGVAFATQALKVASSPPNVLDEIYMAPVARSGFPLGMPAIAVGAAVLVMIAIGIWLMMSSGTSEPPKVISTENPPTTQTAPSAPEVKSAFQPTDVPASGQPDPASTVPVATDQSTANAATAAPSKPKKPAPAPTKAPIRKKAVTVDDLINDN